jgi:CDP-glucose 4,6-dehydratase
VEGVVMVNVLSAAYKGRRVFVTGHTGFKGSWLVTWLHEMGAHVSGYALEPPTDPSLFEIADIAGLGDSETGDIRDLERLSKVMKRQDPEIVFHLAAQAIVRESYDDPVDTFSTNVMGTVHVLEAVRRLNRPCSVVVVTSDKCYENREWVHGYRENDAMGGSDPYSASKGCAELVVSSWRRSFGGVGSSLRIASVRAGNVIGGGDWAKDRIVTDCISSLLESKMIEVRNPTATRPWQHVLEPLSGYLSLGARLLESDAPQWQGPWNFGPTPQSVLTVRELVEALLRSWGSGKWSDVSSRVNPPESRWLALEWDKAFRLLGWSPIWSVDEAVGKTVEWYKIWGDGSQNMRSVCLLQINEYLKQARQVGLEWALEQGD